MAADRGANFKENEYGILGRVHNGLDVRCDHGIDTVVYHRYEVQQMNREIMENFFPKQVKLIDQGKCPFCGEQINPVFRDELSLKEFKISGLCQECQDKTFGK